MEKGNMHAVALYPKETIYIYCSFLPANDIEKFSKQNYGKQLHECSFSWDHAVVQSWVSTNPRLKSSQVTFLISVTFSKLTQG